MAELLVCPNCQGKMQSSKTESMGPDVTVACKTCQSRSQLSQYRMAANMVEVRPSSPTTIRTTTVDVPTRQTVATQVIVHKSTNEMGLAGFVTSLVGILTAGLLSPLGFLFSIIGLTKEPRGLASAGVMLGFVGTLFFAVITWPYFWRATFIAYVLPRLDSYRQVEKPEPFFPDAPPSPVEPSVKSETASASIDQVSMGRDGKDLMAKFTLKNTSNVEINRIKVEILLFDKTDRQVFNQTLTASLPQTLAAKASRIIEMPLRSADKTATRAEVTILEVY